MSLPVVGVECYEEETQLDNLFAGSKITEIEKEELEIQLRENSNNTLIRIRLIGYYLYGKRLKGDGRIKFETHALRIMEECYDSYISNYVFTYFDETLSSKNYKLALKIKNRNI
jgi:hypothetical protein